MNYRNFFSIVAVSLGSFLATTATADSVKLNNGLVYDSVKVTGFSKGTVVFVSPNGKTIQRNLDEIACISLAGIDKFNSAEAYRAANKLEKAIICYRDAGEVAKSDWLRALVLARLTQTALAKIQRGKPKTQPATSPAVQENIDPLSSPETLADLINSAPRPPNYSNMTTLQREEKRKKFSAKLKAWWASKNPVGKEVTWVLQVVDIALDKTSAKFIVSAKSRHNISVKVTFSAKHKNSLIALSKDDLVTIAGTLVRWEKEDGMFNAGAYYISYYLEGKSVQKADKWPPERFSVDVVRFCGITHKAKDVVYVIDKSGSMLETFAVLRKTVLQSVNSLSSEQRFHVIFYSTGKPKENPPRKLVPATAEPKKKFEKFIRTITPKGQTDPLPAIKRAFTVLRSGQRGKSVIYLLTDGEFPDNQKVINTIKQLNKSKRISINTILHHHHSPDVIRVLKKIAEENDGVFQLVWP